MSDCSAGPGTKAFALDLQNAASGRVSLEVAWLRGGAEVLPIFVGAEGAILDDAAASTTDESRALSRSLFTAEVSVPTPAAASISADMRSEGAALVLGARPAPVDGEGRPSSAGAAAAYDDDAARSIFVALDKNGNGVISRAEVIRGVRENPEISALLGACCAFVTQYNL